MKFIIVIAVILLLLVAVVFLAREVILQAIGDYLVIQDDLQPADVLHVIAGPDYRTHYAIQLFHEGYGDQIFFTGGWCDTHGYHGEHGMQLAFEQGVPLDAIAIDDTQVTSTYSEAQRLKVLIDENPNSIGTVIVVSDPYHMRRARWTYRRVLGKEIQIQMAPVPMERTNYQHHWWEERLSRSFVKEEYIKLFYYIARYQLSWGRTKDWLSSLDRE